MTVSNHSPSFNSTCYHFIECILHTRKYSGAYPHLALVTAICAIR
jgi:hypothetical protein